MPPVASDATPAVAARPEPEPLELYSLETDVDLSGRFRGERLAIAAEKLVVYGNDGRPTARHWKREQIEAFRFDYSVGSCFLQARVDGRWHDVLRCPGGSSAESSGLIDRLDLWRRVCEPGQPAVGAPQPARSVAQGPAKLSLLPQDRAGRRWETTKRVASLLKPFTGMAVLLLTLSLVTVAIEVAPPMLQGVLVDSVLRVDQPTDTLGKAHYLLLSLVVGLLMFKIATTLGTVWKARISSRLGTTLTAKLRDELVQKLNALPLAFHDRNQVGLLMSRVAYDTEVFHTLVYQMTSGLLMQLLQLTGIGVALFYLNPKLALITMLPMPAILVASWYFTRFLNPRHHHYWEAVGKQASALSGMLSGIRVVKAFVQEDREVRRFRESSHRLRESRETVDISTATFTALTGFLFAIGGLAVWYIGGRDVLEHQMTLGSLIAFIGYLAMFYTPLTSIAESTTWISNLLTASQRILELLDEPGDKHEPVAPNAKPLQGRIDFENVSFHYQPGRPVLRDVSFSVAPGEWIGVVGRSGSGKSTLVNLITRLYQVESGKILIDGADVREMSSRQLRRRVGMVLQEPFLFRGSVANNITYGSNEATAEQILRAARSADAHQFIMRMPFAYDTQLGEGGSGLSGGERQRLSIARALCFDPKVLILDEATASVDAESERSIREAVWRFARGRTTIVIAHRLSTLRGADRLLVLDQGRLVEQGSHEELLAQNGLYAKLVSIQMNLQQTRHKIESALAATPVGAGAAGSMFGDDPFVAEHDSDDGLFALDQGGSDRAALGHGGAADDDEAEEVAEIVWLDPATTEIHAGAQATIRVTHEGKPFEQVLAVRAFPATDDRRYISLRYNDAQGREQELGMIDSLEAWPAVAQEAVLRCLERRYLLRQIRDIRQVRTDRQGLAFSVMTDAGPNRFYLDRPAENVIPFGPHGLLLLDRQGNYYRIGDRSTLPRRQQRLLELYCGE